ncbi:large subunit of alpha-aminoadipate reductase [Chytriomyces hyalinus]|nr:large subunit of alpha-aminoadipate reductase [Chytriomyces hyalinus]
MTLPLADRLERNATRLHALTDIVLPTDYPRPIPAQFVETATNRSISETSAVSLLRLAISDPTEPRAPFDVLLAAFVILLHKHTGEEDISVGSSSLASNPLVLRCALTDADSFAQVLAKVTANAKEAADTEVSFTALLEHMFGSSSPTSGTAPENPEGQENTNKSLFKVRFFNLTDTTADTLASSSSASISSCDITILISQAPTLRRILPIDIKVLYNSVLFSGARIADMLDQIELILETAASNPAIPIGKLSIVTKDSVARLPDPKKHLHWDGFEGAITDIFAKNAAAHPDRCCIVESLLSADGITSTERTFSYKQIHEASNIVAHALIKGGIQREDVVVLYSYRGVDLVVAVMGVLKSGATFSVIDPAYPPPRQIVYLSVAQPRGLVVLKKAGVLDTEVRSYVNEKLQIKCEIPALEIMTDGSLVGGSIGGSSADSLDAVKHLGTVNADIVLGPDSIGTLSFTSGSTGIPKGVRGRHFSLTHFYPWMKQEFNLSNAERFTMLSGIAHDPIQRDIFTPLFLGAQLHIPTSSDIATPGQLASWMSNHGITITHLTPAMGQLLSANATASIPTLRNAFFVGDVLTKRDVSRLQYLAQNVTIINMYGTTETQRAVSYLPIPPPSVNPSFLSLQKDIMPAGKGMNNVQLLVINSSGLLCGVGEVGEIHVRSGGLAEGYLMLDEVTQSKFLENPFNSVAGLQEKALPYYHGARDRMYKTGDLGRYRPDGSVECTGRADDQVKIRGFRIELGEIDTHLSQHPGVRENVTLVRRDKFEEPTLVSYFVPLSGDYEAIDLRALVKDIREYLKQKLPAYAVPTVIAPLRRMPLTPNGKVDKNVLPFPDTAALFGTTAPSTAELFELTPIQSTIRKVWAEILSVADDTIALTDNFFDLGGHSILATRLIFGLRKALAIEIPMGVVYNEPTVELMAAEVERLRDMDLNLTESSARVRTTSNISHEELLDDIYPYADDLDVVDDPEHVKATQKFEAKDLNALGRPAVFFLTGATGFLGIFVLSSLLKRFPQCKVICLVRAKDADLGMKRLKENGQRHLLWSDEWNTRVEAVVGDLGEEKLGLGASWDDLCQRVDVVVHNGALVHWVYPYHKLRAANVMGTHWALMLATTGPLKAFHLVSSTSVLDTGSFIRRYLNAGKPVPESDDLEGARKGLRSGYGQTKWVAEKLVMRARERGVPATIIRPGYIVGDSKSGVNNTDDFLWRLVKGCIQLGQVPSISNIVNMCSVDYVADAIAEVAAKDEQALPLGVFHIWNANHFRFDDLFNQIKAHGYNVELTDYINWRTALMDLTLAPAEASAGEPHSLFPLLHFVLDDLPTSTRSPELDETNTKKICEGSKVVCEDMNAVMSLYFGYLVAVGFLDAPPRAGTTMKKLPIWDSLAGLDAVKRTGQKRKLKFCDTAQMDAIEYSIKVAAQIALNGQLKESYNLYLSNLGNLILRLKTFVDISGNGQSRNVDEALFRMIPLCRTCINKIEDILQASAISAAEHTTRSGAPVPPPLSKGAGRVTSSFFVSVENLPTGNDASLFSAVLEGFPMELTPAQPQQHHDTSSSSVVKTESLLSSYDIPDSQNGSIRTSMAGSVLESLKDYEMERRLEGLNQTGGAGGGGGDSVRLVSEGLVPVESHAVVESSGKAAKNPPETPPSPLNQAYMSLSQKLIVRINSPASGGHFNEVSAADSDEEESNQIRTRIAKILHQIQIASASNPAVNLFCFRPIAIAFQLCNIEHGLLRNIHSNDILIHKPPHAPAPSLQATSDFFNYFTRLIEISILQHSNISDRVKTILKWIKVGVYLKRFSNFQTLKAVTSALRTPPIIRLKKTWAILKRKNGTECADLDELTSMVSEENNYSKYRTFIKENQTRPMIPYLGVLLHDITYLVVVAKKEGCVDIAADRRVQDIQKLIRFCSLGPRYSYEMLMEMDATTSSSFSGTQGLPKKGSTSAKKRVKGAGLSEYGIETLACVLKDANEEDVGNFVAHWLLSRKWVGEKEIDDLSLQREPKAAPSSASSKAPVVVSATTSVVPATDERDLSPNRTSKSDEYDSSQTRSEPNAHLKAVKESMMIPPSPSLSRSRTNATSNSFISVLESAYTLVSSKQTKPAPSGTSSPAAALSSPGKKSAQSSMKSGADTILRGRPLERLLNRRQKSLTNLGTDELSSASKSVSMDCVNVRASVNVERSFGPIAEKAGGSFDSVAASLCPTSTNQTGLAANETPQCEAEEYHGVASDELVKKLEVLVQSQQHVGSRGSATIDDDLKLQHIRSSSSMVPVKETSGTSSTYRHNFFSFFTPQQQQHTDSTESPPVSTRAGSSDRNSEAHETRRKSAVDRLQLQELSHPRHERALATSSDFASHTATTFNPEPSAAIVVDLGESLQALEFKSQRTQFQDSDSSASSLTHRDYAKEKPLVHKTRRRASSTSVSSDGVAVPVGKSLESPKMSGEAGGTGLRMLGQPHQLQKQMEGPGSDEYLARAANRSVVDGASMFSGAVNPVERISVTSTSKTYLKSVGKKRQQQQPQNVEAAEPYSQVSSVLGWGRQSVSRTGRSIPGPSEIQGEEESPTKTVAAKKHLDPFKVLPSLPTSLRSASHSSSPPIPPKPIQLVRSKLGSNSSVDITNN